MPYCDPIVEALIAVTDHDGPDRVFNIGTGEGRSVRDLVARRAPGWVPQTAFQDGITRVVAAALANGPT